jgi:hypothetical protein
MGTHLSDDTLLDVALRLLPAADHARHLDHLRRCARCEARFVTTANDAERARLAYASRHAADRRVVKPAGAAWHALVPLVAAAALLFAASLGVFDAKQVDGVKYRLPINASPRVEARDVESAIQDRIERAYRAYRQGRWDAVVALLGPIEPTLRQEHGLLVLSSSLLNAGRPDDCRRVLSRAHVPYIPQPDRDRALWILSLCNEAVGDTDQARQLWGQLAGVSPEFGRDAQRRLELVGASGMAPSSTP